MRQTVLAAVVSVLVVACAGPPAIDDPVAELQLHPNSLQRQLAALDMLDAAGQPSPEAIETLHGMLWKPGYVVELREAALERLERFDPDGLQTTIRQRLPQLGAVRWLERLCAIIAEREWVEQTPALISSWARPSATIPDDADRPEYRALVALHGRERVVDEVFTAMLEHDAAWQQGFRTRVWALLHRLGERDRLVALVANADVAPDDAMFVDLRAAANDLGIVPRNREEILWIRTLREPEHAEFWAETVSAISAVPMSRRADLELRDLPVIVACARHEPSWLTMDAEALLARLEARLDGRQRFVTASRYAGPGTRGHQTIRECRDRLEWGDAAAMLLALRALEVPEVADHLFDYADRDRADEGAEYGGIIELDDRGRFEVVEFPPRIRRHDRIFIAPQAMFDAGYTALFHFHFHVQELRNEDYAGPGLGDDAYAENTRANCLVLTSIGDGRMNVDFYRHGGVVVDLGVVESPQGRRD